MVGARENANRPGTGDGINDSTEPEYWTNRRDPTGFADDCDGDGIPNIRDADSDDDGVLDGAEIGAGDDPCLRGDGLPPPPASLAPVASPPQYGGSALIHVYNGTPMLVKPAATQTSLAGFDVYVSSIPTTVDTIELYADGVRVASQQVAIVRGGTPPEKSDAVVFEHVPSTL